MKIVVGKLATSSTLFFAIKIISDLQYVSVPKKKEIEAQAEQIIEEEQLLLRILKVSEIDWDGNFGLKFSVEIKCQFVEENPELSELKRMTKRLCRFLEALKVFKLISENVIEKELEEYCKKK